MHKTLLATFVIGASALAIPALAQVNLGGAAQVGAGVNAGAVASNAVHTVDQTGKQTDETLQHTTHRARHVGHQTTGQARSTVGDSGNASANVKGGGATSTRAGNNRATVNAGVDADVNASASAHGH